MMDGRYAAIDIGTVTCRMLVADVRGGELHELAKEYRITNLGEGVDAARELSAAAMARVRAALSDFLAVRDALDTPEHPLRGTMVAATSAARDARNAGAFEQMLTELGLRLQVISGQEEAALTFAGATGRFAGERVMVVDVGGGSTEVSIGQAGAAPEVARSFDIGCRRVTERFLTADPPTAEQVQAARAWMSAQLRAWLGEVRAAGCAPAQRMVAVAGTATTAVGIREGMRVYDSARVDLAQVQLPELQRIEHRLLELPLAQRRSVTGLDPGRAPVIAAGMLILEEVMLAAGQTSFTVSESDILDGMIIRCASAERIAE